MNSTSFFRLAGSITVIAFLTIGISSCNKNKVEKICPEKLEADQQKLHKQYDDVLASQLGLFGQLPKPKKVDNAMIDLGQSLYFDKRLSKNETISCNSCHNLQTAGVDNLPNSPGDDGRNGDRNSPTVLNAALHKSQFWDGRAKDVHEQAGMPIMNPIEMGIPSKDFLVNRLKGIEEYRTKFSKAFPESSNPITYDNLQKAISLFEHQLLTPSRVDQYLAGKSDALTIKEKKGMLAFALNQCTQCHNGALVGGGPLQKFGVHQDYWTLTGSKHIDKGRFNVTNDELDLYKFKPPSLRNIAQTGPYFHDGSVADLKEAIHIMGKAQLDRDLSDDQVESIEAFLNALTGDLPANYMFEF